MLRKPLLYLSEREGLKNRLLRLRAARAMAARFVAGDDLDAALDVVSDLERRGFRVTLDFLGESVGDPDEAERATAVYESAFGQIAARGSKGTMSLKPTQLGLDLDPDLCAANVRRIVDAAAETGSFVRIDMEGSAHTQATLDLFRRVFPARRNVGVVIQAYLHRSERDIRELAAEGAPVRLCKGAYQEPASIAYARPADVDANFVHLMRQLLDGAREGGDAGGVPTVAIATHDDAMIEATRAHVESRAIPIDAFEFQMLYGVRRDVQQRLLDGGYNVRIYVPYGTEWYPYFMRRMAEKPANLWFVTRAILGK